MRIRLGIVLIVAVFCAPLQAAMKLTREDVQLAATAAQLLQKGGGEELFALLQRQRIPISRLEQVLSAVFLIVADQKIGESLEQVGRRPMAQAEVRTEGSEPRRLDVSAPSGDELRAQLRATREDIRKNLGRYFEFGGPEYKQAAELIRENRDSGELVFRVLQRQQEGAK